MFNFLLSVGIVVITLIILAKITDNNMAKDWKENPAYDWRRDK